MEQLVDMKNQRNQNGEINVSKRDEIKMTGTGLTRKREMAWLVKTVITAALRKECHECVQIRRTDCIE